MCQLRTKVDRRDSRAKRSGTPIPPQLRGLPFLGGRATQKGSASMATRLSSRSTLHLLCCRLWTASSRARLPGMSACCACPLDMGRWCCSRCLQLPAITFADLDRMRPHDDLQLHEAAGPADRRVPRTAAIARTFRPIAAGLCARQRDGRATALPLGTCPGSQKRTFQGEETRASFDKSKPRGPRECSHGHGGVLGLAARLRLREEMHFESGPCKMALIL